MEVTEVVDIKEAARMTAMSVQTLRNWKSMGKGPKSQKSGGKVVYQKQEIDRWNRQKSI